MQHIDSDRLYKDSSYRNEFVISFMDFGSEDIEAIKAVAEKVRPLVPVVVDAVYKKLFEYDVTKMHFVPKNEGFSGDAPTSLEELTLDHPQIKFRKDFLSKYLYKVLSGPYDERFLKYIDWVAKIHTDTPDKKSKINVDYIHINALMGFVESTLVGGLMSLNFDRETETKALLAFNKILWIQNDCFARYYCNPSTIHSTKSTSGSRALQSLTATSSFVPLILAVAAGVFGVWYNHRRV
ncbi:Protoglobin-domain-containing protein [Sporodiniella umbellata]|nr:Protoglobin-domain-containing protein [Sporodiniella umbellata]